MIKPTRRQRKAAARESKRWPAHLVRMTDEDLTGYDRPPGQKEVWRSRHFLVQIFETSNGAERLTINKLALRGSDWADQIMWQELQRLKSECGRGDKIAVELFPPDEKMVNIANMRHLFVLNETPSFMW